MTSLDVPPGDKWRRFELQGLALREFAGLRADTPLNPFELARFANLVVIEFGQIQNLSPATRECLLGTAAEQWSGGACSHPLPDGRRIVILNPTHGPARTNATLMEEISHVFLGHQPSRLKVLAKNKRGETVARDYRNADEEAAYATGAAALVPYAFLRRFVLRGDNATEIARHFRVSRELVEYRLKVTRLWSMYRAAHLDQ